MPFNEIETERGHIEFLKNGWTKLLEIWYGCVDKEKIKKEIVKKISFDDFKRVKIVFQVFSAKLGCFVFCFNPLALGIQFIFTWAMADNSATK